MAKSAAEQWTVVRGLESGLTYEVKVIAADDAAYCTDSALSDDVKRIQIDVKRGSQLTYLLTYLFSVYLIISLTVIKQH